jgi:hypothetical protein
VGAHDSPRRKAEAQSVRSGVGCAHGSYAGWRVWLGIIDSDVTIMKNESSKEKAEQPAPSISADFLTGSTEASTESAHGCLTLPTATN